MMCTGTDNAIEGAHIPLSNTNNQKEKSSQRLPPFVPQITVTSKTKPLDVRVRMQITFKRECIIIGFHRTQIDKKKKAAEVQVSSEIDAFNL